MIFCIVVILLSIAADQLSKYYAASYLTEIGTLPLIPDVFHFTYVENRGAAFGMLSDHRWVFMVLSVLGIGAMIVWLAWEKPKSLWTRAAISLVIGGGIGNMIDRVILGYVIDFIDCRFIDFYVFNIADSCVCVGCAMFVIGALYEEVKAAKAKKAASENGEQESDGAVSGESVSDGSGEDRIGDGGDE